MRDVVTSHIPHELGYCPCCRYRLQSDWTFCPHCGGTIDQEDTAAACHCGKRFTDAEERFCGKCGEKRGPRVHPRPAPRA